MADPLQGPGSLPASLAGALHHGSNVAVAAETIHSGTSISDVARRQGLSPSLVSGGGA